jgi:uncharacterized protein YbaR (Trm112 family)/SAM-dependent methyltransferase
MPAAMDTELAALLQCPRCAGPLLPEGKALTCRACQVDFPDLGGVPCLLPEPQRAIGDWRREAQRFLELLESQLSAFDKELARSDLLPSTRRRLERQREANRVNGERLVGLFRDAGVPPDSRAKASGREFTMVQYYEQILRDWGNWGLPDRPSENQVALDVVLATLGEARTLGRVLVLGAGPSRLAYDLHQTLSPSMTVALDYDPLLLFAAQRVLFGGGVTLTEFPSDPVGQDAVAVEHRLQAPEVPSRFHLIAADAFKAPLKPGSFDTVVTPWFVDIAPADLRESLSLIHGLLAPGGRWLNYGPLSYPAEHRHGQRYSLEEVRELIALAGFELAAPVQRTPIEYLHSRSNARWKVIEAYSFAAQKRELTPAGTSVAGPPPAWLLFSHVPVPPFAQAAGYQPEHPMLGYLMGLIDGKRTSADLAARFVAEHGAKPEAALDGVRAMLALIIKAINEKG